MKGKTGLHNQYTKAKALGLDKPVYDTSNRVRSGCILWDKETWYKNTKGKVGGYRPNAGRSKKFKVKDSYGIEVLLQSTYELTCSQILNELNIKWIRPKSLTYDERKYFPDFYLPEYDVYLDPKNDFKAKQDQEKIQKVIDQNNVSVYIITKDKLNKEWFCSLTGKTLD